MEAMLAEEAASRRRLEKVEKLKIAWGRKMEIRQYEIMLKKLSELTVMELDGDMAEIERLVRNMRIVETGEKTVMVAIIDTDDVEMVNTAQTDPSTGYIKRADEQMDTVIMENTEKEDMVVEHSLEEAVEMDIVKVSVVEEVTIIRSKSIYYSVQL